MSEDQISPVASAAAVLAGLYTVMKKFNFKPRSIKNEKGEEIEKLPKQPSLEVNIPVPTAEKLIEILQGPTEFTDVQPDESIVTRPNLVRQLVLDAVNEVVFGQAKQQLDQAIESFGTDKSKTITVDHIDYDKLTLEFIASIPPARRGATAISDEEWTEFFKDYVNTMVAATGKTVEKLEKHIDIFKKPTKYRARKDLLAVLLEQLAVYATSTQSLEDFQVQYNRLNDVLTKYLTEEDRIDVDAL